MSTSSKSALSAFFESEPLAPAPAPAPPAPLCNDINNREVNESIDSMIGSIEPILTVSVGIILAWIVAAVFGPLYDNLGALNAG